MMHVLSDELTGHIKKIAGHARDEGLEFFPTIFEMLDFSEMTQVAAYSGFPQRYPHWRFGMDYERLRKQQTYGLSKIYEMVINTDPCYAYLLSENSMVDHKLVISHVFGHSDFFKNNIWFSQTNRRMMDEMANHATRIRRHIDRFGHDEVEKFIDVCLSLENLIDAHSMFMRRSARPGAEDEPEVSIEERVVRYPAKHYMDRYINPPERLREERERLTQRERETKDRVPASPQRDVLAVLLERAPLEDWQADILSIIREEAYYFAPQGMTKIMNEGWAVYWHSTLMTRYVLTDSELITYCDHHAGTLATSPGRLNPYKLGLELFRDIESRWNTGRYGKEYDECEDMERRRNWGKDWEPEERVVGKESPGREKIYQVRKIYNDVTFIDEFLTPEFVEKHKLFHYRYDPATNKMVVVNRDYQKIKEQLLFGLANHAQPYIYVVDCNYANRGELYLAHRHNGADLDIRYATETLRNLCTLWGRPVHIQARIDEDMVLFSFDGEESQEQRINEELPKPAHSM